MEHAKKVVLVDEKLYNSLVERSLERPVTSLLKKIDSNHQLSWRRPLDQRVKTNLSKEMHSLLTDKTDDNVKSKLYNQTLSRFHHIGTKLPEQQQEDEGEEAENYQLPVLQQQAFAIKPDSSSSKKKKQKRKKAPLKKKQQAPPTPVKTRSTRKRKIPRLDFDWVEY